jgi:hypothetical protein
VALGKELRWLGVCQVGVGRSLRLEIGAQRQALPYRSILRNAPQPLKDSEFDLRELRDVKRPQLSNGADSRVRGYALRDKRAIS